MRKWKAIVKIAVVLLTALLGAAQATTTIIQ